MYNWRYGEILIATIEFVWQVATNVIERIHANPTIQLITVHTTSFSMFVSRWVKLLYGYMVGHDTALPSNVVIAVCGKKGSGKDTTTSKLRKWMWLLRGHYYKHRSFAKPLKTVVQTLTSCSSDMLETHEGKESVFNNPFFVPEQDKKAETYRDVLKHVGKHTRRYLAHWIDNQWRRETQLWNESCRLPNYWILSDLRLQDELQWLKQLKNTRVYIVRVESPRDATATDRDISEVSVDEFRKSDIDFTIHNIVWDDGKRFLENQCRQVCESILMKLQS